MGVAKAKGLKLAIFGNDGEKDALEAIEAGDLSGAQYTDVFQQGRPLAKGTSFAWLRDVGGELMP
jgi:ABC-type sugar transport system substrate-binding protein